MWSCVLIDERASAVKSSVRFFWKKYTSAKHAALPTEQGHPVSRLVQRVQELVAECGRRDTVLRILARAREYSSPPVPGQNSFRTLRSECPHDLAHKKASKSMEDDTKEVFDKWPINLVKEIIDLQRVHHAASSTCYFKAREQAFVLDALFRDDPIHHVRSLAQ